MPPWVAHGVQEFDQADPPGVLHMRGAAGAHVAPLDGDDADVFRQVQLAAVVQGGQLRLAGGSRR